jgi:hypothetical protein
MKRWEMRAKENAAPSTSIRRAAAPYAGSGLLAAVTCAHEPQMQLARALEDVLHGPLYGGQREGARPALSELRHEAGRAVELPGFLATSEEALEQRKSGPRRVVVHALDDVQSANSAENRKSATSRPTDARTTRVSPTTKWRATIEDTAIQESMVTSLSD